MIEREFSVFADYFQIYLEDENAESDFSDAWTVEAIERLLALNPKTPDAIAIGTARNMSVPLIVRVLSCEPDVLDLTAWDQVNECSLDLSSGTLVICGCTEYRQDANRISVNPDVYRVRLHYGKLESLRGNGLQGDDHYLAVLWPSPRRKSEVLKQRHTKDV